MARNHANVFTRQTRWPGQDFLNPRNGRAKDPHLRDAQTARETGRRSRYERCPRCKKLRMKWMDANWWHPNRRRWERRDGQLVCHICCEREDTAKAETA